MHPKNHAKVEGSIIFPRIKLWKLFIWIIEDEPKIGPSWLVWSLWSVMASGTSLLKFITFFNVHPKNHAD